MHTHAVPGEDLSALAGATARRSLHLLRAIEETLGVLSDVVDDLRSHEDRFRALAEVLWAARPAVREVDPEGVTEGELSQSQEVLRRLLTDYERRLTAARLDRSLCADDGIVGAYEEAIEAVRDLFDAIEEAKDAVREHDADATPTSDVAYTSAAELLARIKG